jgi:hypothetical protein
MILGTIALWQLSFLPFLTLIVTVALSNSTIKSHYAHLLVIIQNSTCVTIFSARSLPFPPFLCLPDYY